MAITRESIENTATRIARYIRHTPVIEVDSSDFGLTCRLFFKLEMLQHTGTFKFRGAINLLLASQISTTSSEPVVAASGGNFATAIGEAAATLGRRAHLFVPSTSPPAKIDRVRATGADVTVIEGFYADAFEASRRSVAVGGGLLAHAYDQIEVVEGAGTCGLEITQQVSDVDTVLVPVGGGGLIAGIAAAVHGDAAVIGVETEQTPTLHASRAAGHIVDVDVGGIAVSSLGSKRLGDIAWKASQDWIEDALLVTDDSVKGAQRALWSELRLMTEPGAAVGMAALQTKAYRPQADETVVVVLSGANVDPTSVLT